MIPGGKGGFELAVGNCEPNHHYRYAPLIFGCQDGDFCSRKLGSLPSIWLIMSSRGASLVQGIAICICVLDTVLFRSTRRSKYSPVQKKLDMVDDKICNQQTLKLCGKWRVKLCLSLGSDKLERKVDAHSNDGPSQKWRSPL